MTTTMRARLGGWLSLRAVRRRVTQRWSNAPVRSKFLSIVLVAALLCVPPLAVAIALQLQLADVRATTDDTLVVGDDLHDLEEVLLDADEAVRYAILGFPDQRYRDEYRAAVDAAPGRLEDLRQAAPSGLDDQVDEVAEATQAQLDSLDNLSQFGWPTPGESPYEGVLTLPEALISSADITSNLRSVAEQLDNSLDRRVQADRAEVDKVQQRLGWATLASLVVVLLAVAGGMAVVTRGIVRRIEVLNENGQRFLRGDEPLPEEESADEIGQLSVSSKIVGDRLDERRLEAVAATRAKDEFLSHLSHELRTPLTAVIGFGQLLESDDLPTDSHDSAHRIVAAGHHLLALIDELLDIAKIETGHLSVSVEPLAVGEVVAQSTALVQSMAAARAIEITTAVDEGLMVAADRQRLTQVLLNLLSNAVKYNRYSGRVHVAAATDGEAVRISVTDTGSGIRPDDIERVFRPFERLGAEDTDVEGSGIGLALSRRLVEAMGGTIGVDTEIDRGSTFWVELAAASDDDDGTARDDVSRDGVASESDTGPDAREPRPAGVDRAAR
jgi:signal transduction histidine kinase